MMIWKYEMVAVPGQQIMSLPEGAEVLKFGKQGAGLFLWAAVDSSKPLELREYIIAFTGQDVARGKLNYLDTVETDAGLVFHIFERKHNA